MKNSGTINRRDFMMGVGLVAASGLAGQTAKEPSKSSAYVPLISHDAPPRNRRPYQGLDWSRCAQITTTAHGHCENQEMLDAYVKHGFGLLTISNYYPSAPRCPGKDFTRGHYRFHTDFPVMVNGRRTNGPFDWNKIIAQWRDEIDEKIRATFPFDPAKDEKLFSHWPEGMLEAPNAEHHYFKLDDGSFYPDLHVCAPGSRFKSGTIDEADYYRTHSHGYCFGSGEHWRTAFDRMIAEFVYPDGGGVTINHPTWSNLDRELILKMLDHDPRVLGCEVLNAGCNNENYWDWFLSTGRQCFGFFSPDWEVRNRDFGANILVVPERTVEACLRAYRQGNFYGSLHALGELRFTSITFDGKTLTASTDRPARFEVVTARGVAARVEGRSVSWTVQAGRWRENGPAVHVFARVRAFATDGSQEVIWSQPFMLTSECVGG